ncbi:hypothetical protein M9H77_27840 [Catharanthus roseus]|uniref:Uncharacterized protein n=1 Tax=Catharanthus roseus TaxID=4058 RepID=A0ACC0AF40_CATRO|nr:hypothetical protein M9H77_27840 [Catharanthus roseus]
MELGDSIDNLVVIEVVPAVKSPRGELHRLVDVAVGLEMVIQMGGEDLTLGMASSRMQRDRAYIGLSLYYGTIGRGWLEISLARWSGWRIRMSRSSSFGAECWFLGGEKKLVAWNGRAMCMAGRALLLQISLHSLSSYAMQTTKLHTRVLHRLEKISKRFLWGEFDEKRKLHMISWKKVCHLKYDGGLGFRWLADMNTAALCRLFWRFFQEGDQLWVEVLRGKYEDVRVVEMGKKFTGASYVWQGLLEGFQGAVAGSGVGGWRWVPSSFLDGLLAWWGVFA